MNTDQEYVRRVVCAANLDTQSGDIILGARHWDEQMHNQFSIWRAARGFQERHMRFKSQGFIDQHGVFMDRREAWKVAQAAGQIIERVGGDDSNGGTLYSENLY